MRIIQNNNLIKPLRFQNIRQNVFVKNVNPLTRAVVKNPIVQLWAKFNSESFDGINVVAFLESNTEPLLAASVIFKVYLVSNDDQWTETLVSTKGQSVIGDRFKENFSELELGQLDGETTISIQAEIIRQQDTFKKKIYLNHLGIFDSLFRLKQEVEFLDLIKKDE